jgi:hypothetical protein
MIYWFTGQPSSGKTVLSKALKENLEIKFYKNVFHIDGDDIREIFDNKDYSKDGRYKNIILAQQITKFLHLKGYDVVVSLVSPYKELRENFKKELGTNIKEIYLHTTEIRGREQYHTLDYEPPIVNEGKNDWVRSDTSSGFLDGFMNDFEITGVETDYIKSLVIQEWLDKQKLGISMMKFGVELKKYVMINKVKNVYTKQKKLGGKPYNCWFGIKEIIETYEIEENIE